MTVIDKFSKESLFINSYFKFNKMEEGYKDFRTAVMSDNSKDINRIAIKIYENVKIYVFTHVTNRGGSEHDVKQTINDAILVLIKKILDSKGKFKLKGSMPKFVFGICKKIWLSKTSPTPNKIVPFEPSFLEGESSAESPDEVINYENLINIVKIELDLLKPNYPDYQEIFILYYFHKLNHEEISKILRINPPNTRKRFSRANQKLRKDLKKQLLEKYPGQFDFLFK